MWLIITLILVSVVLLVVELVLLPGLSVAGICAVVADIAAIYFAFANYGTVGGIIVIAVIVALSVGAAAISLRARTWQRFSLKNQVDGTAQELPEEHDVKIGDRGMTVTRIAPMGKIEVNGKTFEGKSIDKMLDPRTPIEVIGFENFSVIIEEVAEK